MSRRDFAGARWTKSSYSQTDTNCVELAWIKSSFSGTQDNCVELAQLGDAIGVRDSKKGDTSPILEFTPAQFAALITETKAGAFDGLA